MKYFSTFQPQNMHELNRLCNHPTIPSFDILRMRCAGMLVYYRSRAVKPSLSIRHLPQDGHRTHEQAVPCFPGKWSSFHLMLRLTSLFIWGFKNFLLNPVAAHASVVRVFISQRLHTAFSPPHHSHLYSTGAVTLDTCLWEREKTPHMYIILNLLMERQ